MKKNVQNKQWHPSKFFFVLQKIFQTKKLLREVAYLELWSTYIFLNYLVPPVEVRSHCRS
jgi:hypothetical protein